MLLFFRREFLTRDILSSDDDRAPFVINSSFESMRSSTPQPAIADGHACKDVGSERR